MKSRKQKCSRCKGMPRRFLWTTKELCTDCDGTGEEYIITPEEWEEYQDLIETIKEIPRWEDNFAVRVFHNKLDNGMKPWNEGDEIG